MVNDDELIARGKRVSETVAAEGEETDEVLPTVPWPTLKDAALHGTAGKIVGAVAPFTEADPAAILLHLLGEFGACVGRNPICWRATPSTGRLFTR